MGNDNGYRYSLFSIFDYEVLKYSECSRCGRNAGSLLHQGGAGSFLQATVTRARIRDCTVHERAHSLMDTFIYRPSLVNFNPIVSA